MKPPGLNRFHLAIKGISVFLVIIIPYMKGVCQPFMLKEYEEVKILGFAHSEYDTLTQGMYSKYYEELNAALKASFEKELKFIDITFLSESIDTAQIISICREGLLDGLLVTRIYFFPSDFIYKGFLKLDQINKQKPFQQGGYPCYVEVRVFNRNGQLILWSESFPINGYSPKKSIQAGLNNALEKARGSSIQDFTAD